MADVNEAYDTLSDTVRRVKYNVAFAFTYDQRPVVEETLDSELTRAVITRLARERRRKR